MAVTLGPKRGFAINALLNDVWDGELRRLLRAYDQFPFLSVLNVITTAPPGAPANGDAYIVAAGGTGAWAGHDKALAVWTTDDPSNPAGIWEFYAPHAGWTAWSVADAGFFSYSGAAWSAADDLSLKADKTYVDAQDAAEATARAAADVTLAAALTTKPSTAYVDAGDATEAAARTAADALKASTVYVDAQDAAEVTARGAAVTAEAAARVAADALKASIVYVDSQDAAEVTARNTAIAAEAALRVAADALKASIVYVDAQDAAETARATAAEASRVSISLPATVGFRDDFLCVTQAAVLLIGGNVLFVSDSGPWQGFGIGGSGAATGLGGTFSNPGLAALSSPAVSGQGAALTKAPGASASLGALGAAAGWEAHFIVAMSSAALVAIRLGFVLNNQHKGDPPTDGMWVRFDTAVPDANFTFETRAASVSTISTANSIAGDTAFHHFKLRSLVAGTILFSVDGGTETAINTNIPAGAMQPFVQILSRTAAIKTLQIDFASYMAATGRT